MATTNYLTAVHYLNNSFVLCNNVPEIDPSIWDNMPAEIYDEENPQDIYQYFISDCSEDDAEYLYKHFGLLFVYSEILDCYILLVTHFGTCWSGVLIETDLNI